MKLKNEIDLKISDDGDLIFENNEMVLCHDIDYIKQQVYNRIRTMNPDWFYDSIGADLEQLLGEPNTKDTAVKGIDLIRNALTKDNFIDNDSIFVKPTPIDNETIDYYVLIKIDNTDRPLTFKVNIALSAGINVREV